MLNIDPDPLFWLMWQFSNIKLPLLPNIKLFCTKDNIITENIMEVHVENLD